MRSLYVLDISYGSEKSVAPLLAGHPGRVSSRSRYKAQSYSDTMHMSKQGIYDQLTSEYGEDFDKKSAKYAIEHVKANWKKNALAKAKSYQKDMHMSKSAIYDQLISEYGEQFTAKEAKWAVNHL